MSTFFVVCCLAVNLFSINLKFSHEIIVPVTNYNLLITKLLTLIYITVLTSCLVLVYDKKNKRFIANQSSIKCSIFIHFTPNYYYLLIIKTNTTSYLFIKYLLEVGIEI